MSAAAQTDHVANSYKATYDSLFPTLRYTYHSFSQTHDYSGNWDFDGDKIPDSLMFVGNGGAHLYFHLRLGLSSERTKRDFHFIVSDFPMLDSVEHFKKVYSKNSIYPVFVVHDFDGDGNMDIYISTDIKFAPIPAKWKRRGVSSGNLLIGYKKHRVTIENFEQ